MKENQSTLRPSEHPPVMGGKISKRLGGIKGCKYKTSSWHLNRFPDADNIGSTVYIVGEKPTVILYIYISRHAGTPEKTLKTNQRQCSTPSHMVVVIYITKAINTKLLHGI